MAKMNEKPNVVDIKDNDTILLTLDGGNMARIKKNDFIESIRKVMTTATNTKNGLMSYIDKGRLGNCITASPILVWSSNPFDGNITTSMLISIAGAGNRRQDLYFVTINRAAGTASLPVVTLKVLAGDYYVPMKYDYNTTTGEIRVFLSGRATKVTHAVLLANNSGQANIPLLMESYTEDLGNALDISIET